MGQIVRFKLLFYLKYSIYLLLFNSLSSASYSNLLWEREINTALNNRDNYYNKVGIEINNSTFSKLWFSKRSSAIEEQLVLHENDSNCWYYFLIGIISTQSSQNEPSVHFNRALEYANNDPGILWVLFLEFRRANNELWAGKCLENIEKIYLKYGVQSVPVLSHQLLSIARLEKNNGNNNMADKYYEWSSRFERYPLWQTFSYGLDNFPKKPIKFIKSIISCLHLIINSWFLQISLFYYLYQWFYWVVISFIAIILFIFSLEALPISLHKFSCLFPQSLPYLLRYFFCIIILLSFSVFGIIPFFILIVMLIWPNIKNYKKNILTLISLFLLLSPCNSRIQEMFRSILSQNETLGFYRRALEGDSNKELKNLIYQKIRNSTNNYLLYTAAAIYHLKKNDLRAAIQYIKIAENINENDPSVLITAGNIYNKTDKDKAIYYYKKCLKLYPNNEIALFNLGQINLSLMNPKEGTQQISRAAELNPKLINTFIEKNSHYFSDKWPDLRKFMQPYFHPSYFWRHVLIRYSGTWNSTSKIWGSSFFGIPPLHFLLISLIISLIFISIKVKSPLSSNNLCKLCGKPVCRKCKVGTLCTNCNQATGEIKNETLNKRVKSRIKNRKQNNLKILKILLSFLFPGSDSIYQNATFKKFGFLLIIISSIIYASYMAIFSFSFSYPFWIIHDFFRFVFYCLLLYNGVFIIRAIKLLVNELRLIRSDDGS